MKKEVSIIIEVDQYPGNVERSLSGFLFGMCDDHGDHIAKNAKEQWENQVSQEQKNLIGDFLEYRPVDEYGMMPYKICFGREGKLNGVEFFINNYILEDDEWRCYIFEYLLERTKNPINYTEFDKPYTLNVTNMYLRVYETQKTDYDIKTSQIII